MGGVRVGGAAGIIAEMPSVLLNNGQGEEINRLSKYQTCLLSELNDVSWVTMAIRQTLQISHLQYMINYISETGSSGSLVTKQQQQLGSGVFSCIKLPI